MKPLGFSVHFQFRKIELISLLGAAQTFPVQAMEIIAGATKSSLFKGYGAKIKSASGKG